MDFRWSDSGAGVLLLVGVGMAGPAAAGINVIDRGTSPPSLTVPAGPSAGMPVSFAPVDTRPVFSIVPDITLTPNTSITLDGVTFPGGLEHRRSATGADGWVSWRMFEVHDVYRTLIPAPVNRIVIDIVSSRGVDYFGIHALGVSWTTSDITARAFDSGGGMITSTQSATSSELGGAVGWAFWTTGGTTIQRVELETLDPIGFAVAEFGAHEVPAPASLVVLAAAALPGLSRRRRG